MSFFHREIHSFEDAQRNFEQIEQAEMYVGAGPPAFKPRATGAYFFRKDTPAIVNQRIYIWTGSAWTGIV